MRSGPLPGYDPAISKGRAATHHSSRRPPHPICFGAFSWDSTSRVPSNLVKSGVVTDGKKVWNEAGVGCGCERGRGSGLEGVKARGRQGRHAAAAGQKSVFSPGRA